MKIPNAENAILDISKLRDYSLNAIHPKGKDKARVFLAALGIKRSDAVWLRAEILTRLPSADARKQIEDKWGTRYAVDVEITHREKSAIVRTNWIILRGENQPRFVTCRVI